MDNHRDIDAVTRPTFRGCPSNECLWFRPIGDHEPKWQGRPIRFITSVFRANEVARAQGDHLSSVKSRLSAISWSWLVNWPANACSCAAINAAINPAGPPPTVTHQLLIFVGYHPVPTERNCRLWLSPFRNINSGWLCQKHGLCPKRMACSNRWQRPHIGADGWSPRQSNGTII